jgi:hypothetical protein
MCGNATIDTTLWNARTFQARFTEHRTASAGSREAIAREG